MFPQTSDEFVFDSSYLYSAHQVDLCLIHQSQSYNKCWLVLPWYKTHGEYTKTHAMQIGQINWKPNKEQVQAGAELSQAQGTQSSYLFQYGG